MPYSCSLVLTSFSLIAGFVGTFTAFEDAIVAIQCVGE